jgi:glycosyltransferase involved in cell wall biosynthesis
MNFEDQHDLSVVSRCECPNRISISRLNSLCLNNKFHLNLDTFFLLLNKLKIIKTLKFIPRYGVLMRLLSKNNLRQAVIDRPFDSLGKYHEIEIVKAITEIYKPNIVGTNYTWLSNLVSNLSVRNFTFIHDLRSRNLQVLRKNGFESESLKSLEDEIAFSKKNDFLVTCNLQDKREIESIITEIPIVHVTLSEKFIPKTMLHGQKHQGIRLVYIDAGGFRDHEIREFLKETWPNLNQNFPEITLRIVGSICDYIQDLNQSHNVVMERWVDDLERVYREADLALVLHFYRGGIKLKLFEALQNGVPVIASEAATDGLSVDLVNSIWNVSSGTFNEFLGNIQIDHNALANYFGLQKRATENFLCDGYSQFLEILEKEH